MGVFGEEFNKNKYIVDNIDRALSEGWIEVYYQPIIRTSNGRVCGEEALVRWEDPVFGMLNPIDFVPAVEAVNKVHLLDLFVLERTIEKMEEQLKRGLFVVPTSVNLSQVDFYTCDVVDEIATRVEKSKISKHMIAVSVSEDSINPGDNFILSQLEQLQELGFQIWLDDYGSGDAAPAVLQLMHFDLLKINIFFVRQIANSESAKIILTEFVRMAMSLGMETVVEGVESAEQVDFLNEIGCSRMQGFYYCKPISVSQVLERYEKGTAIGFEDPKETDYYASIGKINLYDISFARKNGDLDNYFDTFPVAIVESNDDVIKIIRENHAFRDFLYSNSGIEGRDFIYKVKENAKESAGEYTVNAIRKCAKDGKRVIFDDRTRHKKTIQLLLQRVAVNPVTKVAAVAVVILQIGETINQADTLTYNYIARALSEDYINLFYVNMDTDEFVEYNPDGLNRDVSVENKGTDFFNKSLNNFFSRIYSEDLDMMNKSFTKDKIIKSLKNKGTFSITYRRIVNGEPIYVNLKAVKVREDDNYILIGVNNVDDQVKQREAIEKIKEERKAYSRIMALSGDFINIYSVDPVTNAYVSYNSSEEYGRLNLAMKGEDFFEETARNVWHTFHPDDIKDFLKVFDKKTVLKRIEEDGIFVYKYRVMVENQVVHWCLRATLIQEDNEARLLVGVMNIEKQVVQEREYATSLIEAEERATKDQLTGVKNKRAYADEEEHLNTQIQAGVEVKFAIIVCDLNGLKQVNDNQGHQAGDDYIKEGCMILCDAFARSPVYRIGGDEFVAIAQGKDYEMIENRLGKIDRANKRNDKANGVTMAVGWAKFGPEDRFVSDVFDRADSAMYENKKKMKEIIKNRKQK
ncbi:diguanylate cyclase (GGDEF) domain-containing protein [Pseudobutyrivibrio ruminis]|uniref:Diguanylate cyclase (GGDEF) domain-containing protein n=1 Tax=Pseudobutyrivibrio ruminis TaxID=46206 RepID=A0A1H7F4V3_9FIRM|nr:GGDEF domain-containing protein [Pseudobutyrivibrio ruminis]SEK18175.1 diguanylate cyclase (GGDEF) domain-containing protein [Pseudobutyrivibrio ruminis]